jgi:hypothetical protein
MGVTSIHHNMSFPNGFPNVGIHKPKHKHKKKSNTIICFVWNMKAIQYNSTIIDFWNI